MVGNTVIIIGRMTKNPELRELGELTVLNFTLAKNRIKKDKEHPVADFIDCVAWGNLAKTIATYVTKGQQIAIRGKLQTDIREITTASGDVVKVKNTVVVADELEFVEKLASTEPVKKETPQVSNPEPYNNAESADDDIPF